MSATLPGAGRPLVLLLNGPNLDLLGEREPEVYGRATLADHVATAERAAARLGLALEHRQTNHEGEYVEFLHAALDNADALVVNPGAWTHYSWAIRDALEPFPGPVIEVHLSNIHAREPFRHQSWLSPACAGIVIGFGVGGYALAIDGLARMAAPASGSAR